jgi:hypothetical protein
VAPRTPADDAGTPPDGSADGAPATEPGKKGGFFSRWGKRG